MQNINPLNNRNRRSLFYLGIIGFPLLLGGLIAFVLAVLLTQFPLLGNLNTVGMILLFLASIPLVMAGGVSVYRGLTLDRDNALAYQVGEHLQSFLDGKYTYIRNVSRRKLGYIDAVLIGPPGALVFRVVDYKGTWRNERALWFVKDKRGTMKAADTNPSRECARDVDALRNFLAARNLEAVPVYGVVVFHNTAQGLNLQGVAPVVPISETPRLQQILAMPGEYLSEFERITPQQAQATLSAIRD